MVRKESTWILDIGMKCENGKMVWNLKMDTINWGGTSMMKNPRLYLVVLKKKTWGLSVGLWLSFFGKTQIWDCQCDSGWKRLARGGFWTKSPPLAAHPSSPGSTRQLATFCKQERVRAILNAKSASSKAQPGRRATWTAKLKPYVRNRA